MKRTRFFARFLLLSALLALPVMGRALDTPTARTQIISQHCPELRLLLDRLQRRDLVSRTNLGREYETTDKQLTAFTQRIRSNNINNTEYMQVLEQLRDATTQFREAYVRYDDSLNKLQQVNCQANPDVFNLRLIEARSLRDTTEGTVTHAAALVGRYRDLVAQIPSQLPAQTTSEVRQ